MPPPPAATTAAAALRTFLRRCGGPPLPARRHLTGAPSTAAAGELLPVAPAASKDLQFCVVGSGPAGFYTAEKLLRQFGDAARVDVLDQLPTPFGLVRSGVAPDHPETKLVNNQFAALATNDARCRFVGNVALGRDVSLAQLRRHYHGVILAYGAESDRQLGIPGEASQHSWHWLVSRCTDLGGMHSAREFVWWYNGHPWHADLAPDLNAHESAVVLGQASPGAPSVSYQILRPTLARTQACIFGSKLCPSDISEKSQGNVALDVARILLRDPDELAATDIAAHALTALRKSTIRKVYLVGRRGPAQAACTARELRELLNLKSIHVHVSPEDLDISEADKAELKVNRSHRRVFELFQKAVRTGAQAVGPAARQVYFVFFRRPTEILGNMDNTHVNGVRLEKTTLQPGGLGKPQRAIGLGEFEDIPCGLVLRSIGYKSIPVTGLHFDHAKGIVPNRLGRVLREVPSEQQDDVGGWGTKAEHYDDGLYVVGWLKRGPTGVIATNLIDAEETVASIAEDSWAGRLPRPASDCGRLQLLNRLADSGARPVDLAGWQRIDAEEVWRGALAGKPREKIVSTADMLQIAGV
eukprot:SM000144S00705  [mRNA]  locus=s144:360499:365389:- [translate_table: standard]